MNPLIRVPLHETEEIIAYYKYLLTTQTSAVRLTSEDSFAIINIIQWCKIQVDAETEKLREQQVENKLRSMEAEFDTQRSELEKLQAAKLEKKKAAKQARKDLRTIRTTKKGDKAKEAEAEKAKEEEDED